MLVKRTARKIVNIHKNELKMSFEENKKILPNFIEVNSKKLRNVIAGYVTRLMKQEKKK